MAPERLDWSGRALSCSHCVVVATIFVPAQQILGVMEGVGSRLPAIEMRRRYPFGIAVGAFSGGPTLLEQPVMRAAGQGELVDVGAMSPGPIFDVVHLAVVAGDVAARM